uniref:Uncharacterized protein n=1 Tax=Poecilia formosa TaxID=48698 RepID=A0A096LRX1_POEFO
MRERCLTLRARMRTSSPLAGRAAGTPCTTSCRVPPILTGESCPLPCLCPSCTSTLEEETKKTPRTATAPLPQPSETQRRGTAKLPRPRSTRRRAAGRIKV